MRTAPGTALRVSLDTAVPASLDTPRGGALFVSGCCVCESERIAGISLSLGGPPAAAMTVRMPRREGPADLYGLRDPGGLDPERREEAELSGFWGIVPVPAVGAQREVALELEASLEGGSSAHAALATVGLEPGSAGVPKTATPAAGEASVAICMTTLDPSPRLFAEQIETIRAQTHRSWTCTINDDGSRADLLAEMREAIAGDERFSLSVSDRTVGAYGGFERALGQAPGDARYVAFADQHGRWDPTKLTRLVEALDAGAQLAYSDMRVVDQTGARRGDRGEDAPEDPLALLLRSQVVPGAASAFRRELLDYALPFPPRLGARFRHDDWLALVATALGRVTRVRSCLHEHVLSHPAPPAAPPASGGGLAARLAPALFGWREAYFADYCRLLLLASVATARCGPRMAAGKRRSLARLAEGGTASHAALLARHAAPGAEAGTARRALRATAWPAMIRQLAARRPSTRRLFDASLPPAVRDAMALSPKRPTGAAELERRIESLPLRASASEPRRVNVLLPSFDLDGLFAGYVGIYNVSRRLAQSGLRPRLVPVGYGHAALPPDWKAQIEGQGGLAGLFEQVEVGLPREGEPLAVNPEDAFVASSWWTAHVAHRALAELGRERFLYLIQDHEPSFYPAGSWAALASASYELPHFAMFSSELLRDHFRRRRFGVFADGDERGDRASVSFQNAITAIDPPSPELLAADRPKRLLFYARPEEYAPRNLFDLGLLALTELVEDGTIDSRWQLNGVGTVTGAQRIELAKGVELDLISRQSEDRYVDLLLKHDLGLSLMYSPHPSLVPLEMASAGMIVVTNTYENKTQEALAAISENLIAGEPTLEGVKRALREGVAASDDLARRRRGAEVAWSRDWNSSLDEAVMTPVVAWLNER